MKGKFAPNRVAVWLTAAAGLAGAVAVPLANLDTSSTVGVVSGLATIALVAIKFLDGWQSHEQRLFVKANPPGEYRPVAPVYANEDGSIVTTAPLPAGDDGMATEKSWTP